tara:strand:+ start:155 stop:421 length:267 start_codon:yes stop_codon:yes gene_type:complete
MGKSIFGGLGARLSWAIIFIWFGANLLSQALYLGFNGEPYDANQILMSLGVWYWVCIVLELIIWLTFGSLIVQKFTVDVAEKRFVDSA